MGLYLGILIAAIVVQAIGFFWYSPSMFGNLWMKLSGFKKKDAEDCNMAVNMVVALIGSLIMGYVLSMIIPIANSAWMAGVWAWLGFVATVGLGGILWEKKPVQLYVLNMAYWLVALVVMGLIIGQFL